jgi:hypothetical protein
MSTRAVGTRNYWLWITTPEYYCDDDTCDHSAEEECDRQGLEPSNRFHAWWTCCKKSSRGDLVFFYRTAPKSDIAYLIEIGSQSSPVPKSIRREYPSWKFRCDYRVVHKFDNELHFKDMLADPILSEWPLLRAHFQGVSKAIPGRYWWRINELLIGQNPGYLQVLTGLLWRGDSRRDSAADEEEE